MDKLTEQMLIGAAKRASRRAYCVYSNFPVGAAVLSSRGKIFSACNIENASFGLTSCAERNAIFRAISEGERSIVAIVIYTPTPKPTAPCGSCRQVVQEFADDAETLCVCDGSERIQFQFHELLPGAFKPSDILFTNQVQKVAEQQKAHSKNHLKRICVDIDNVVAQTDVVMRQLINATTSGRVNLAYEDVKYFDYCRCTDAKGMNLTRDEWALVHERFSEPEVIESLEPFPHAVESLFSLADSYKLHFATSRLPKARGATVKWLKEHGLPEHDLHFLKHGEKHASLGRFDVSIEDDPDQANAFAESGFGMNILIAHPWNSGVKVEENLLRANNWPSVLGILLP